MVGPLRRERLRPRHARVRTPVRRTRRRRAPAEPRRLVKPDAGRAETVVRRSRHAERRRDRAPLAMPSRLRPTRRTQRRTTRCSRRTASSPTGPRVRDSASSSRSRPAPRATRGSRAVSIARVCVSPLGVDGEFFSQRCEPLTIAVGDGRAGRLRDALPPRRRAAAAQEPARARARLAARNGADDDAVLIIKCPAVQRRSTSSSGHLGDTVRIRTRPEGRGSDRPDARAAVRTADARPLRRGDPLHLDVCGEVDLVTMEAALAGLPSSSRATRAYLEYLHEGDAEFIPAALVPATFRADRRGGQGAVRGACCGGLMRKPRPTSSAGRSTDGVRVSRRRRRDSPRRTPGRRQGGSCSSCCNAAAQPTTKTGPLAPNTGISAAPGGVVDRLADLLGHRLDALVGAGTRGDVQVVLAQERVAPPW